MFNWVLNLIGELMGTLNLSSPLNIAGLFVVVMLFGSPGVVGLILATGTTMGVISYNREEKKK